ncbi:MAG: calcium/sodium antiporter [Clostridia bacterium]|nr:calcium/sodium antiporter [Clostridia bacterium]
MAIQIILIIIGFVLLIKGADLLVNSASNIAKKFHIPEIIIGLTVISIGTSLPELFISITSANNGYSDMSIGNVIGSNISNLLLILGLSSIIKSIEFKKETKLIEIPLCFFITVLFFTICNIEQNVTRIEGFVFIFLFILFIIYTIVMAFKGEKFDKIDKSINNKSANFEKKSTFKDICFIILGIIGLKFGGDFTVENSVIIAKTLGLSEKIISITILALGTSLPELVTSISAAIKGKSDIAIGNILGSNIFNILLIIGISAIIKPVIYNLSYNTDIMILVLVTTILMIFPLIPPKNKMSRVNGIIYVSMYFGYIIRLFLI